eukprot:TRINITY_DN63150_c0_g1_i1.p1 TRINITY_DN63150_c0_g1~~TRINITY_DN63150_c0_g1_i1.p1  ORF type:complete len:970 (+),score=266.95 TRINITY_DN63150_c0_g1_i1:435-3344(+)
MFCMGSFCGKFHDELQGDSDEDDEAEDDGAGKHSTMRGPGRKKLQGGKKAAKAPKAEKAQDTGGGGSGYMRWSPFLNRITVKVKLKRGEETSQQVVRLQVVNKNDIPASMMNSISQLAGVHTIDIIRCECDDIPCNLMDMDTLSVLRMSHNYIRKFPDDLARVHKIERIILDWNRISDFPRGIFSHSSFLNLQVLNLAHNKLSNLPIDFGITASEKTMGVPTSQLKYVDLSYNSIPSLPDSVTLHCKNLEVLNLSHNCLKKLPDDFELKKLQRLFVSFNQLAELPANIGTCSDLTKLRIISNQIREFPSSILQLWKKRDGKLEELLPDRNPLVMPSITTFEMAASNELGIDQAFHLFEQHLEDEAKRVPEEALAIEAEENTSREHQRQEANALKASGEEAQAKKAIVDGPHADIDASDYYFGFTRTNPGRIAEIRNAESTLLLLKRRMYVMEQKALAEEEFAIGGEGAVSEHMRQFLADDFQPESYRESVPVSPQDIDFVLLVLGSKSLYNSCHLLFDKFECGEKGYMLQSEWFAMCCSMPSQMDERKMEDLWSFVAWRRQDRLLLTDFIAAWHIHDIERRDPWISRCAAVLKLEFYNMTFRELRRRLRAKNAFDATPDLEFKAAQDAGLDEEDDEDNVNFLKQLEGLSRGRQGAKPLSFGQRGNEDDLELPEAQAARGHELMKRVALSGPEHAQYENLYAEDEFETASLTSEHLSEDSEGEDANFDAQVYMQQHRDQMTDKQASLFGSRFFVNSDEGIRKLMEIKPSEFFGRSKYGAADAEASGRVVGVDPVTTRKKAKPAESRGPSAQSQQHDDPKMKTDVFGVRQTLRLVYRNMPYHDFVKLISFLLRGMQLIRNAPADAVTYWHADDPTFKHTMGPNGGNPYTRELLRQMGFVILQDIYWVWPSVHLDPSLRGKFPAWGDREIAESCPGKDSERLADIITLLWSCQRTLYLQGQRFTGHFKTLEE